MFDKFFILAIGGRDRKYHKRCTCMPALMAEFSLMAEPWLPVALAMIGLVAAAIQTMLLLCAVGSLIVRLITSMIL